MDDDVHIFVAGVVCEFEGTPHEDCTLISPPFVSTKQPDITTCFNIYLSSEDPFYILTLTVLTSGGHRIADQICYPGSVCRIPLPPDVELQVRMEFVQKPGVTGFHSLPFDTVYLEPCPKPATNGTYTHISGNSHRIE